MFSSKFTTTVKMINHLLEIQRSSVVIDQLPHRKTPKLSGLEALF